MYAFIILWKWIVTIILDFSMTLEAFEQSQSVYFFFGVLLVTNL